MDVEAQDDGILAKIIVCGEVKQLCGGLTDKVAARRQLKGSPSWHQNRRHSRARRRLELPRNSC